MHGGLKKNELKKENLEALKKGMVNLKRHIENVKKFGLEPIVALNHFVLDTKREIKEVLEFCEEQNVKASVSTHWSNGGNGAKDLAKKVIKICKKNKINKFKYLYSEKLSLWNKIEVIAKEIYRAHNITASDEVKKNIKYFKKNG